MARDYQFETDQGHTIDVQVRGGRYFVSVDGAEKKTFTLSWSSAILGPREDFPISVEGQVYMIVVRAKEVNLAKDGVLLDTGEAYTPIKTMPKWFWIFGVLNLAIPFLGGMRALDILLGCAGAVLCGIAARSGIRTAAAKIGACLVISLVVWVTWMGLVIGMAGAGV